MFKPTIRKIKDIRGRKIIGHTARIGELETDRQPTKVGAIDALRTATLQALERLGMSTTIGRWREHTIVVYPTLYGSGWAYWIDTYSPGYSAGSNYRDSIEAYTAGIYHLAQSIWTPETDDYDLLESIPDIPKRKDLASWIAFQRTYKQIQSAGEITESGALHQAACEQSYVYYREHFASIGR